MERPKLPPEIRAAYAFVELLKGKADHYQGSSPLWHSWALREAFLAGVRWAKEKRDAGEDGSG